jgi:hypothetical protein
LELMHFLIRSGLFILNKIYEGHHYFFAELILINAQQDARVNHKIDTVFLKDELVGYLETISKRRKEIKSLDYSHVSPL